MCTHVHCVCMLCYRTFLCNDIVASTRAGEVAKEFGSEYQFKYSCKFVSSTNSSSPYYFSQTRWSIVNARFDSCECMCK